MPKKMVNVEVESSGHDLMISIAAVVKAQKASGHGLQEALAQLMNVVQDVKDLPADAVESKLELIKGINLGAYEVAEALL